MNDAIGVVKFYELNRGFAIIKGRSLRAKTGSLDFNRVWLMCDRRGAFTSRRNGTRETSSRKTGCRFTVVAFRLPDESWEVFIKHPEHNHPPTDDMSAHPSTRLTMPNSKSIIESASRAGTYPLAILSILHEAGERAILKDIYNYRAQLNLQRLENKGPVEAVLHTLRELEWTVDYSVDNNQRLTRLFFVPSPSLDRFKLHHDVLIVDATYKTNKYNMPLVHVCGITASAQTYHLAFCFVQGETTSDYLWIMERIRQLYDGINTLPLLIVTDQDQVLINACAHRSTFLTVRRISCLWHVKQNVKTRLHQVLRVEKDMSTDEVDSLTSLKTSILQVFDKMASARYAHEFDSLWQEMQGGVPERYRAFISYFETRVHVHHDRWAMYQTHRDFTFGIKVTSRAEAAHAEVKRFLGSPTLSLEESLQRINNMITVCESRMSQEDSVCRVTTLASLRRERIFSSGIHLVISRPALRHFKQQLDYARSQDFQSRCSGLFTKSMGILCAHSIFRRLNENSMWQVQPSDFHVHWRFDRTVPVMARLHNDSHIQEPLVINSRRNRVAREPMRSTQRVFTHAENVQREADAVVESVHRRS